MIQDIGTTRADRSTPALGPVGTWCCAIELAERGLRASVPRTAAHREARVLVRLHDETLGYITVDLPTGDLDPTVLHRVARAEFAQVIDDHLRREGITPCGPDDPGTPLHGPGLNCPAAVGVEELVTVVVCTRDRGQLIAGCLRSLAALTYPALDIVIVDNAPSNDATRRAVELYGDGRFRHVVEPRPGLSAARNRGLAEARGRWVAYTDDDVVVDAHWIEGVVRGVRRREDVGAVTGLVATASISNRAEAYFDARAASWSTRTAPETFDLASRPDDLLYPYSPGIFGTGANLVVDRDLVSALGGFDEALGAGTATRGGEDLDLFVRVLRAGRAIAYEPSALVWHHHRADERALRRQMYAYGTGLSAYASKYALGRSTRTELLRRLPSGVRRIDRIRRRTSRSLGPRTPAPRGAFILELTGLLAGPLLYLRARSGARRSRTTSTET
ncbi:glycosyltransferase family 2 protein [Actinomycetospora lemnae]|uniref:Glycosyltransferase n=1 Tax=Actinomycetospora lemnae TaxID=3019891 RepID=A0ABT5SYJ5_9PSEU|nr:glycosyltransferase [Actinomycetospora sp. DW7H6]MDD7966783.1 glycosyltransferase [Actinomycetospora sp. DW7H6]